MSSFFGGNLLSQFLEILEGKSLMNSGRKSFKSVAKSVGKLTLKKQLGEGKKQTRIIPTKSTKQSSWSRRDIFTNISR